MIDRFLDLRPFMNPTPFSVRFRYTSNARQFLVPLPRRAPLRLDERCAIWLRQVRDISPLSGVYHLYRKMGLRHLPICNVRNEVVGIITRQDLRTDFGHDLF